MPRSTTVLPISSTDLEVDLLDTFTQVIGKHLGSTIPLRLLWNADLCPYAFLQHLAVAVSVDGNIADYNEEQLRTLIRGSVELHTIKGTVGSIKDAVELLGYTVESITEGDRDNNGNIIRTDGRWANFQVTVTTPIPIASANAAVSLIEAIAPVSRKLTRFDFKQAALRYDGGINDEGEYTFFGDGAYTHGEVSTANIQR